MNGLLLMKKKTHTKQQTNQTHLYSIFPGPEGSRYPLYCVWSASWQAMAVAWLMAWPTMPFLCRFCFCLIFESYLFIYSWETHRERQRHRQREKQALSKKPDVGFNPKTSRSWPEPKADAQPPRCSEKWFFKVEMWHISMSFLFLYTQLIEFF